LHVVIFNADFHSVLVAHSRNPVKRMLEALVEKMLPVPNFPRKAKGWSCIFQQWHPSRFGCDCLSKSCRIWREAVTGHILVEVQHPWWTVVI